MHGEGWKETAEKGLLLQPFSKISRICWQYRVDGGTEGWGFFKDRKAAKKKIHQDSPCLKRKAGAISSQTWLSTWGKKKKRNFKAAQLYCGANCSIILERTEPVARIASSGTAFAGSHLPAWCHPHRQSAHMSPL